MLRIENWAKDKPIEIVVIVLQSLIWYESSIKLVLTRVKQNDELFDISDIKINAKNWLSFYRSRRYLTRWIFSHSLEMLEQSTPNESPFPNEQATPQKSPNNPPHNFGANQELIELFNDLYLFTIDMYKEVALGSSLNDDDMSELPENLRKPEMLFYLKVFSPCFFIYGELPGFLLRKARLGDIDAIDKLLRVDKTLINDPFIGEQFHQASMKKNKSDYKTMVKALEGQMLGKVSQQKIKSILAGFISLLSESFGHRLSSTEIRELFNAIAVDRGQDELLDPDIQDSPEALSQAILRERKTLAPLFSNFPNKN